MRGPDNWQLLTRGHTHGRQVLGEMLADHPILAVRRRQSIPLEGEASFGGILT